MTPTTPQILSVVPVHGGRCHITWTPPPSGEPYPERYFIEDLTGVLGVRVVPPEHFDPTSPTRQICIRTKCAVLTRSGTASKFTIRAQATTGEASARSPVFDYTSLAFAPAADYHLQGNTLSVAQRTVSTLGPKTAVLYSRNGTFWLLVSQNGLMQEKALPNAYSGEGTEMALESADAVCIAVADQVRRWDISGPVLNPVLTSILEFPGSQTRDLLRMADGRMVRLAKPLNTYAIQVDVMVNGALQKTTVIPLPPDGGGPVVDYWITGAQSPGDGLLYVFVLRDASATISASQISIATDGTAVLKSNKPYWVSYQDLGHGPYSELPWISALPDPNTGKVAVAYLKGEGPNTNRNGTEIVSPAFARFSKDTWTFHEFGTNLGIALCDPALGRTFLPTLTTLQEKTSQFSFLIDGGKYRLAWCPVIADMSFQDLVWSELAAGAMQWKTQSLIGPTRSGDAILGPGWIGFGGPDGQIHLTKMAATPSPEPLPEPVPEPPPPLPPPPTPIPIGPPTIRILSPPNGAVLKCGQKIQFTAEAKDAGGNDITSRIRWGIGGHMGGSASTRFKCNSPLGSKIVQASVVDSGLAASAVVSFTITR